MTRSNWFFALAVAAASAGCSSSSSSGAADASGDIGVRDARGDTGHDAGHPSDAHHDATQDATTDAIQDAAVDAPIGLTCGRLIGCDQKCTTTACTDACFASATGVAQGLFDTYTDCLAVECPGADASSCDVSATEGACVSAFTSCETDKKIGPPDPDGGAIVPTVDAGGELNCGEYTACVSACSPDAGAGAMAQCTAVCSYTATPQAIAFSGELNACLATACPTTDGGVCSMQGTACAGCQEQAIFALPNTCAPQFTACEDDSSNRSDGGTTPTSLQDGGILNTTVTGLAQAASSLVVSNNYLYYAQVEANELVQQRLLVDGGATNNLGPPEPTPAGLAVDANNLYVWSYGTFSGTTSFNNGDGTLVQVPLSGGAAITLRQNMEVLYDAPYLNSVAFDATHVYWVEGAMGNDGAIMKTPIGSTSGGTPIFTGRYIPEAMTTDGTNVYWADWGTFDSTGASNNDATVLQGSINGGAVITLATAQNAPGTITVDAHNVYWTNLGRLGASLLPATNSGSIVQAPIGGGTVVTVAPGEAIPISIAVANGKIYWTEYGLSEPGLVVSVPIGGGTVTPLVGGLRNPFSMTLSGNTLYWTNTPSSNGGGTILSFGPI